jgi:hypothetical protein
MSYKDLKLNCEFYVASIKNMNFVSRIKYHERIIRNIFEIIFHRNPDENSIDFLIMYKIRKKSKDITDNLDLIGLKCLEDVTDNEIKGVSKRLYDVISKEMKYIGERMKNYIKRYTLENPKPLTIN